jgi:predicted phage tail protein
VNNLREVTAICLTILGSLVVIAVFFLVLTDHAISPRWIDALIFILGALVLVTGVIQIGWKDSNRSD